MPTRRLLVLAAAIGVLEVVADVCVAYAAASGPISVVGPLGTLGPVVAVVAGALAFREPPGWQRLAGVLICASGVVLVAI